MRFNVPRLTTLVMVALVLSTPLGAWRATAEPAYRLWTVGNEADVATNPRGGIALMGGGPDVDDAFRWMLGQSQGGDVVVIRASGGDGYNGYIAGLQNVVTPADSVTTILFRDRAAAANEVVLKVIREAELLFIAGGDQSAYLGLWQDTPLESVIAEQITAGMVIGGTSAGAMMLGEHIYSATRGSVSSRTALRGPFDRRVTLTSGFLDPRALERTIVDSHFGERNRTGRLIAFMARIAKRAEPPVRGLGLDEETAMLIDRDGSALVVGSGQALLLEGSRPPQRCSRKKPLTYRGLSGFRAEAGDRFDIASGSGDGLDPVAAAVVRGRLQFSDAS